MNNVLTQIIGEKLGNLEDVAKSWKKRRHWHNCNMQYHQKRIQTPILSENASFLSASTQVARCKLHWIRYISFQVFRIYFFLNFSQRKRCKEKPNNTHWLANHSYMSNTPEQFGCIGQPSNHFKYLQQRLDVKCFSALITVGRKDKLIPNVISVTVELLFKCLSSWCAFRSIENRYVTDKLYPLYNLNMP